MTGSCFFAKEGLTGDTGIPTAAGSRSPHTPGGDTFTIKTLQKIIEHQARWTEEDLRRLGLL